MKEVISELVGYIISVDGEQWFGFLLFSFFVTMVILAIIALSADHKVSCHYSKTESTNAGTAYKIMADVNWAQDHTAFTTSDPGKMLEVLSGLKQCAAK